MSPLLSGPESEPEVKMVLKKHKHVLSESESKLGNFFSKSLDESQRHTLLLLKTCNRTVTKVPWLNEPPPLCWIIVPLWVDFGC